ncbi:putative galacturonosyltransferase 7 isoform X2 [Nicotiana tabacum]|uniref:Hexosyltransferase n=1 Tax=Nicotiana tabacum TaxID=4097 RepID=A0A1S4DRQ2_TOBAC|nr:probable galacturonosyltransferase 7 isoform X2 [Nicotiana tomentosiformis]XP_016515809.1 PREDICTED: probable galacturonosyltransferase 7 isoform X2 [Nicotiana tabacum]
MKGGIGGALPAKRRWKGFVIAVLGLVLLSLLVPLVFLLGLHNGFHSSGLTTAQQSSTSNGVRVYSRHSTAKNGNQSEGDESRHMDDLMRRLEPTFSKDIRENFVGEAENKTAGSPLLDGLPKERSRANSTGVAAVHAATENIKGIDGSPMLDGLPKERSRANSTSVATTHAATENIKGIDEGEKLCELKFGSYCLWRHNHKEKVNDLTVRKMKDLLYVARAYYPSIAKLPALDKLSHEMKQNIQEFERVLSVTTIDKDLPPLIDQKLTKMEAVIAQAKACRVDCSNVDKKFRQLVDLTEDEATFHMRQSAFLYQLAVQTMPKSHHCLSMRLTVEYFRDPSPDIDQSLAERHLNPDLHHFVIFSNNVLASSAVINSTVMHAKESESQVFHVVTDRQNYFAMKLWFSRNKYMEATVEVLNIEDVKLDNNKASTPIHLSLPDEYRVSFHKVDRPSTTEYLSVFSHSHYLLPQIFHSLKKVVVLDDDVIVQRDLSDLWGIDMDGKVNGAVQSCSVRLAQLRKFFGNKRVDETSCAWMSGLNVVDLVRWREQDISGRYLKLVKEMNSEEAVTLRASLLTFQGEVYALDDKWVLSGLGHKYGVDIEAVKNARVLHFNGKMKPWLELGIHDYTVFWRKFVDPENQFLSDCNIN